MTHVIAPYYEAEGVTLYLGDCVEVMRALPAASVDAVVTDPPYGLEFMGKDWDAPWKQAGETLIDAAAEGGFQDGNGGNPYSRARVRYGIGEGFERWCETWGVEALRVLKPGGYAVVFGGTRTEHRMKAGLEDAGFEVVDTLAWLFGSGFPKSLNISKAIEATLLNGGSNTRRLRQTEQEGGGTPYLLHGRNNGILGEEKVWDRKTFVPTTEEARAWEGWGTALKPGWEPAALFRKPLDGTYAHNVLTHGVGGLNIDATRIGTEDTRRIKAGGGNDFPHEDDAWTPQPVEVGSAAGRWPANVALDEEAAALLDATVGELVSGSRAEGVRTGLGYHGANGDGGPAIVGDRGGPSRFFYTAKASRSEREAGLEDMAPQRRTDAETRDDTAPGSNNPRLRTNARRNDHPTVKPVDLMRWLCRLVTPPGGVILDPFLGSGTTLMGALDDRYAKPDPSTWFRVIGIDREEHYDDIARRRVEHRHLLDGGRTVEPSAQVLQGRLA